MKKIGFTVSEILITLTVIGTIAALTTPFITRLFPDKNKAMVLKVHKTVQDINSALLDNTSLYYAQSNAINENASLFRSGNVAFVGNVHPGVGFNSTLETFGRTQGNVRGSGKYLTLLTDNLELIQGTLENDEGIGSFRTRDGLSWSFNYLHFTIDVNGFDNNPDCSYAANCTRPDQYDFLIDIANGNVSPNDPLTEAYLSNPDKMNDKARDFAQAGDNLSNDYDDDDSNPFDTNVLIDPEVPSPD